MVDLISEPLLFCPMYTVYVEDYFHSPLTSSEDIDEYRWVVGEYASYEEALRRVRTITENVFRDAFLASDGSPDEICLYWIHHGEDAWISPVPDGAPRFSGRDYFHDMLESAWYRAATLVRTRIPGMRKGTTDKPAYMHSFHVRDLLEEHGYGPEVCCAGLLHDIVEDGGVSLEELRAAGFSERVVRLVDLCSHDASIEGNDARWVVMIARLVQAGDADAWAIKVADLVDNLRGSGTMKAERREWMINVKRPLMVRVVKGVNNELIEKLVSPINL